MVGLLHPTAQRFHLRSYSLAMAVLIALAALMPLWAQPGAAQVAGPGIQLNKTLVAPLGRPAIVGESVVFDIALQNVGSTTIVTLPLADTFDATTLRFTSASIGAANILPSLQGSGLISWTNLLALLPAPAAVGLAPGESLTVRTTFETLAVTQANGSGSPIVPSGPPSSPSVPAPNGLPATPNDFYDLETIFVIDKAIDPVNGGIYLALKSDGTPWATIPAEVYGFEPNTFVGTSKHPGGQALCIEYFIQEYHRLSDTGRTITTQTKGVLDAQDMLLEARGCADFVNAHLIIGKKAAEPAHPACTLGDDNTCLYYWGFVADNGNDFHFPAIPYSDPTIVSYNLSDSFLAWSMAELALTLKKSGSPDYTIYRDAASTFWNWAKMVGTPRTPPSGDPGSYAARDRFWANLGMTLYEVSVAEGAPQEALRSEVIDCVNQKGFYATSQPLSHRARCNGTSYSTAYGRSPAQFMEFQNRGIDQFDLPGARPTWHNYGDNYYPSDPKNPLRPERPFAHGSGRELVAGSQRSHWFYYTSPDQSQPTDLLTGITVANPAGVPWTVESWSRYAILEYWNYASNNMWDNTPGQQAWWESSSEEYKPCFSLGTPVPLGDWKAPAIGNKVHSLNPDGSATVTVSGVEDGNWPYLNWQFRGIGVEEVRVHYSTDDGLTWSKLIASESPVGSGTYIATIPPAPGKAVRYYAEAQDFFRNTNTFPAGAPGLYQLYTQQNGTFNLAWSMGGIDANGTRVPPDQDHKQIEIVNGPTPVTLARFDATAVADGTRLRWQTGTEQNNYGFHVYYSATRQRADAVRVTSTLIAGRGRGAQAGASYEFVDRSKSQGGGFYWLEAVDLAGGTTWHGPAAPLLQSNFSDIYLPLVIR